MDVKLSYVQHYAELAYLLACELMEEEVESLTGRRFARARANQGRYHRWGSNPGSIRINGVRVPVEVPRVRDHIDEVERPLDSYQALHEGSKDERLDRAVLLGLSTRDYQQVGSQFVDGFGLSQSSVSRRLVERSAAALERFDTRSLVEDDFVALWLDGKWFAGEQVVLCMGLRMDGVKRVLGFVECATENAEAVKGLFRRLIERGLRFEKGLLVIVDGSRGLEKATRETFAAYAQLQRCQWHKRENVLSYLKKSERATWQRRLSGAYHKMTYREAKGALMEVHADLEKTNRSAAASLLEGLEETLTLHRLGLFELLGKSLKTTNCIEGLNSQLGRYLGKVNHWMSSDHRQRWIAMGSLEAERRMTHLENTHALPLLRQALLRELSSQEQPLTRKNSN